MASFEAFAFHLLPRWTRREVALTSLAARALQSAPRTSRSKVAALDPRFAALFDGLEYSVKLPRVHTREAIVSAYQKRPSIVAVFSLAGDDLQSSTVGALAVDAPLARWLAARALGMTEQEAARWLAPIEWTAGMEGAFAVVCAQAAWRALSPGILPVFRAATDSWDDVAHALGAGNWALWSVDIHAGSVAGLGTLLLPTSALRLRQTLDAGAADRVADLTLNARLVAASAQFLLTEIAQWAAGDLLALSGLALTSRGIMTGVMRVRLGRAECKVRVEPTQIIAEQTPFAKGSTMSDADSTPSTDPTNRTALLSALTVEVEVVVARSTVTVAEVSAWRAGEVIAMPTPVASLVELHAGGRVIARGELVTVEDELAVRITEIL